MNSQKRALAHRAPFATAVLLPYSGVIFGLLRRTWHDPAAHPFEIKIYKPIPAALIQSSSLAANSMDSCHPE